MSTECARNLNRIIHTHTHILTCTHTRTQAWEYYDYDYYYFDKLFGTDDKITLKYFVSLQNVSAGTGRWKENGKEEVAYMTSGEDKSLVKINHWTIEREYRFQTHAILTQNALRYSPNFSIIVLARCCLVYVFIRTKLRNPSTKKNFYFYFSSHYTNIYSRPIGFCVFCYREEKNWNETARTQELGHSIPSAVRKITWYQECDGDGRNQLYSVYFWWKCRR